MDRDRVQPGELDRLVYIDAPTETRTTDGSIVIAWTQVLSTWARMRVKSNREYNAAGRVNAEQNITYLIRYSALVGPRTRLRHANRTYDIIGVSEIGRGHFLELAVKELRAD